LQWEDVDLMRLVRRAADEAPWEGHRLTITPPAGPFVTRADADRVTQILVNLLENAAKYSPRGEEILVDIAVEAGEVRVTVTDSGIGLPASDLDRLFTPFARAAN